MVVPLADTPLQLVNAPLCFIKSPNGVASSSSPSSSSLHSLSLFLVAVAVVDVVVAVVGLHSTPETDLISGQRINADRSGSMRIDGGRIASVEERDNQNNPKEKGKKKEN